MWIEIKIPAFYKWLLTQETLRDHSVEFEYWATGGFTLEAREKLNKFSKSVKKYKVSYYTSQEMKAKTIGMKNKKMGNVLDNYFLKSKI